jgi:hypothetical protein
LGVDAVGSKRWCGSGHNACVAGVTRAPLDSMAP